MRYVPCYALKVDNEYIPYWQLKYVEDKDNREGYRVEDDYKAHYCKLTECLYDLVEKKILLGIVKDVYENSLFIVGEQVVLKLTNTKYTTDTIKEIIYEKYKSNCIKVNDFDDYKLDYYFTKEEANKLKLNDLYEIRVWKPYYLLESGELIKYDYQLAQLV